MAQRFIVEFTLDAPGAAQTWAMFQTRMTDLGGTIISPPVAGQTTIVRASLPADAVSGFLAEIEGRPGVGRKSVEALRRTCDEVA